jgi:hypothetical protein
VECEPRRGNLRSAAGEDCVRVGGGRGRGGGVVVVGGGARGRHGGWWGVGVVAGKATWSSKLERRDGRCAVMVT